MSGGGWDWYFLGMIAGAALSFLVYPFAYHRGWMAGFNRHKNIMRGGD